MGTANRLLGDKIQYADDMYSVLEDADVLAVLTEWGEFKELDLAKVAQSMRHKNIVDCRNLFDGSEARKHGFNYQGIGK
jgi:UDPglucose 6-dehydrogenase